MPSGVTGTCTPSSILSEISRAVTSSTPLPQAIRRLGPDEDRARLRRTASRCASVPSITRDAVSASAAPAIAVSASSGET